MEIFISFIEVLSTFPVGELLVYAVVVVGVINLIRDDIRNADAKRLKFSAKISSKQNENASKNLKGTKHSDETDDRADFRGDFERKSPLNSNSGSGLKELKLSDNSNTTNSWTGRKENVISVSKDSHQELDRSRDRVTSETEADSNVNRSRNSGDISTSHQNIKLTSGKSSSSNNNRDQNEAAVSKEAKSVKQNVTSSLASPETVAVTSQSLMTLSKRVAELEQVIKTLLKGETAEMTLDKGRTKTLALSDDDDDDDGHVNRLCNVYASSGDDEDDFVDCESVQSSPRESGHHNAWNETGNRKESDRRTPSRSSQAVEESRDRAEGECQRPEEGDPLQMALLRQDNDNFRLWNELLLKENAEFSCEITHIRTNYDQLRLENEQLKKEKQELLELLEIMQSKKSTKVEELANTAADVTDGRNIFVREQPVGASYSAEDSSASPTKEVEEEKEESVAPVASVPDNKTTTKIPNQMRLKADVKRNNRFLFQFVFVGDSGVGKTSFIRRFCDGKFNPRFNTTVGVDFLMKNLKIDGREIFLQVWDTAGQERFRSITRQYFRKADGVIVMYDVTSENSFKNVRSWMNSVQEGSDEGAVIAIVGNKSDLVDDADSGRVVTSADGADLAKDFCAFFYESSAKTGQGVDRTMIDVTSYLFRRRDLDDFQKRSSVISLSKSRFSKRRTQCCMTSQLPLPNDVI